jgi:class 3 adenylate cyclase
VARLYENGLTDFVCQKPLGQAALEAVARRRPDVILLDLMMPKLDAFVHWVERVVDNYDGSLVQLTMGDKGNYPYIAFGVPVAHYDDAVRAASATLELQSPPSALQFITGIQIGVAYGPMRAGAYGSPAQRAYGVIGDKTNLAAHLMQAAADGILCDEAIYQAAQAQLSFAPLPP